MKNIVFYFSGTGNNLYIAKSIAEKMKDTKLKSILRWKEENLIDYQKIGFVFPIYNLHMPIIVEEQIKEMKFNKNQYIFGVIGHAGSRGIGMQQLKNLVGQNEGILLGQYRVRMPGNYIVSYGAFPKRICTSLNEASKQRISEIVEDILKEKKTVDIKNNLLGKLFFKNGKESMEGLRKLDIGFHINEQCSKCKTCEKVCPVQNIHMTAHGPKWEHHCEQCMACIQWCPNHAIEYGEKTKDRKRYVNPYIHLSEMYIKEQLEEENIL